ncbi:MAG: cell wall-binding repeat-containing protein [Mogibacterium sp.]|nr:cell wall-binding repeat-containing protein [Mogibacterium sp.]
MRVHKRVLAALLALSMVLTFMPSMVFAEAEGTPEPTPAAEVEAEQVQQEQEVPAIAEEPQPEEAREEPVVEMPLIPEAAAGAAEEAKEEAAKDTQPEAKAGTHPGVEYAEPDFYYVMEEYSFGGFIQEERSWYYSEYDMFSDGDTVTVRYTDGQEETLSWDEGRGSFSPDSGSDTYIVLEGLEDPRAPGEYAFEAELYYNNGESRYSFEIPFKLTSDGPRVTAIDYIPAVTTYQEGDTNFGFNEGDLLTVTFSDHSTESLLYDPTWDLFRSEDSTVEVPISRGQLFRTGSWAAGSEDARINLFYNGAISSKPIEIIENEIGSIEFEPAAKPRVFNQADAVYYLNAENLLQYSAGNRLTVHSTDGTEASYVSELDEDGQFIYVNQADRHDQFYNYKINFEFDRDTWYDEHKAQFIVTYGGQQCVIEADARVGFEEIVRYTPVRPYQYYDEVGFSDYDDDGEEFFYYEYDAPQIGDQLVLRDFDGADVTFTCAFDASAQAHIWRAEDGTVLSDYMVWYDDDQYDVHWGPGGTYVFTVYAQPNDEILTEDIPITYGEGTMTLSYQQVGTKVYYQGVDDWYDEDRGPFYDEDEALQEGDILTVTLSDRSEQYRVGIDEDFYPYFESLETGEILNDDYWYTESDQRAGHYWGSGDHQVTLWFRGSTVKLNVAVRENPVRAFRFDFNGLDFFYTDEIETEVLTDGSDLEFTFYNVYERGGEDQFFVDGDKVTLTYKDAARGSVEYLYDSERDGFYSEDGEALPFYLYNDDAWEQYLDHWDIGVNYVWFECAGYEDEVPITILNRGDGLVERVAGADRYATSQAIADRLKLEMGVDKFDAVILASGDNFPDALCGSYLAYKKNAPILITSAKGNAYRGVNRYVLNNLKEDGEIYVLGGPAAITEAMIRDLTAAGYDPIRLSGQDRYETNLKILDAAGVTNEEILIASGAGFADSLSASAVKRPILLVGKTLTADQKTYLEEHSDNEVIILGGTGAVGSAITDFVTEVTGQESLRLAGPTRYETSIAIAEHFFTNPEQATIAYAWLYPDGLCGGPLAAAMNCPLILTNEKGKEERVANAAATEYFSETGIKSGITFGGAAWMTNSIVKTIYHLISENQIFVRRK